MHIRVTGNGPSVLLLGGCPTPAGHLAPLADRLSHSHRVLLPDLPGYGDSPMLDGEYTILRAQRVIENAVLDLDVDAVAIVGVSLGAYRAFSMALTRRLHVTSVVTLGGFAGIDHDIREAYFQFAAAIRNGVDLSDVFVERMFSSMFAASHPDIVTLVKSWLTIIPATVLASELEAAAKCADLRPRLGFLSCPVLARVGSLDAATPIAFSEAITKHAPNAHLDIVEGSGHLLLFEDRDRTIAAVERFLSSDS